MEIYIPLKICNNDIKLYQYFQIFNLRNSEEKKRKKPKSTKCGIKLNIYFRINQDLKCEEHTKLANSRRDNYSA